MKRYYSILFILVMINSHINLYELTKIPNLFHHYKEHKAQNNKTNLLNFIFIHYFNETVVDNDYEKDIKLPFKSEHSEISANCNHIYYLNSTEIKAIFQADFSDNIKTQSNYKDFYQKTLSYSIWQPPKIV